MKLTVKEFRQMISKLFIVERNEMQKSELYSDIEYRPDSTGQAFFDRWGNQLPSAPKSLDAAGVRDWLMMKGVDSISVKGKKMSPKNFERFIAFMHDGQKSIPVIKGSPDGIEQSSKSQDLPVVRGAPAKQKGQSSVR